MDFDFEERISAEPEARYAVNRQLNMAWQIVEETGANLFLTGRAGTGKTTFLKTLREKSSKRMVVLAPTGVAAINARGNTIHSFFQLPFSPYIPGKGFATNDRKFLNMSRQKRRLIASLSLLVIDEISMVRPDTLDAIDSILRRIRNSSLPFGGLQLLLIGDLRQLPPVVKEKEWEILGKHYATPYFFESHALRDAGFLSVELSVVYRQSDSEFISILNAIRDGKADTRTLSRLNSRCRPNFNPGEEEGYIRLTTHNRNAAVINDAKLAQLHTPAMVYDAEITGEFPESALPAEQRLVLREGAQVMFIKNDTGGNRRYYNGLIGTILSLSEDKIIVQPSGEGEKIEVERVEWENTRYNVEASTGDVIQEVTGVFRQFPLQLAWAITIHKSQGLTFEKAIIDASHSFAAGQTYVALSRCRSLKGLVLESPVPPGAIITDADVNDFISYCKSNAPNAGNVSEMKNRYLYTLLFELFDFAPLRRAYENFSRYAEEYLVPVYPSLDRDLSGFKTKIKEALCDIGSKFLRSYSNTGIADHLNDPDSGLSARIQKGCLYFLETVEELGRFLNRLPTSGIDNRTYAERLNNAFDPLIHAVGLKQLMLSELSELPFTTHTFLNAKAKAVLQLENPSGKMPGRSKTRASGKKEKNEKDKPEKKPKTEKKKPKGYSTFETLRLFREGKTIPQIAQERNLAESTIGSHIFDLIRLDKVKPDEIADSGTISHIASIIKGNPGLAFGEYAELANRGRENNPIPSYILSLFRKLLTQEN